MMRFATISTFVLWLSVCPAQISQQECNDQGGIVVGDIGNGAIYRPGYVCHTDGLPPTDFVRAGPGEPIAIEGAVCCGENDKAFVNDTDVVDGSGTRPEMSVDDCAEQGGVLIEDIGDGSIHREDFLCEFTGLPPIGTVIARSGEPTPREGQVCCPSGGEGPGGLPLPDRAEREEYTRQECTGMNGLIVGDIGNGAIFEDVYICESSGLPPIANIVQNEEPFASEGEVCCQSAIPIMENDRDEVSRQECEDQGGEIIGDIGDGETQSANYTCDSNSEPPIANVIPGEGEPIAPEGEVCCGPSNATVPEDSTVQEDLTVLKGSTDNPTLQETATVPEDGALLVSSRSVLGLVVVSFLMCIL